MHRLGKLAIQTCYTIARTLPATTGSDPRSSDRFHYTFGMHKTCTIVRSFLSKLDVDDLPEGDEGIIRLFVHECRRELVDMLVSHGDARSACATIDASIEATFGFVPTPSFFSSFVDGAAAASGEDRAAVSSAAPAYRETVGAGAQLVEQVEAAISKSRQREIGSLVFFDDALHHVLKVTRVLESDRRSVMLVGVGGSGKKSIAKVAAAVAGVSLFCTRAKGPTYGVSNFLDDLGAGFKRSGIKGEAVCFLMSDADVCDGVFLDFVNQQLMHGTGFGSLPEGGRRLDRERAPPGVQGGQPGSSGRRGRHPRVFLGPCGSLRFHFLLLLLSIGRALWPGGRGSFPACCRHAPSTGSTRGPPTP